MSQVLSFSTDDYYKAGAFGESGETAEKERRDADALATAAAEQLVTAEISKRDRNKAPMNYNISACG